MGERLAYLRSIRDGNHHMTPLPAPRPEAVKECAILLKSNPSGRRTDTRPRDAIGDVDESDSFSSPLDQRADSPKSSNMGEPSTRTSVDSENTEGEDPSPGMFRNPWSTYEDLRYEKVDALRERCPSRSGSFLSDVASLLSGLSIRSSLSRSSSGSSRRSIRSVSSRAELTSSSAVHGDWHEVRPLSAESISHNRTWSGDLDSPVALTGTASCASWVSQMAQDTVDSSYYRAGTPHTRENRELVRFCCSKTAWCLHQRINAVLAHSRPAESFSCTAAEVNSRDGLGNTALHVAARWGAPGPVLLRIMTLTAHLGATNHRGETFLHVLDPSPLMPRELGHFTSYLASRGFNFTHRDDDGKSFIDRLLASPAFALESLESIFSQLTEPDRLALLHDRVPVSHLTHP